MYRVGMGCACVLAIIVTWGQAGEQHRNPQNEPPSKALIEVGPGFNPSWSPDGKQIACVAALEKVGIYLVKPDGSGRQWIESLARNTEPFSQSIPWWSPDGRQLAVAQASRLEREGPGSVRLEEPNIFVLDGVTQHAKQVTFRQMLDLDSVRWSPRGGKMAFVAEKQDVPLIPVEVLVFQETDPTDPGKGEYVKREELHPPRAIWVVNSDGTEERQVTHDMGCNDTDPTWSPDETRIAFTRMEVEGKPGERMAIWVTQVDGTGLSRLTEGGWDFGPCWSPDGRLISYFHRTSKGDGELWVIAPETRHCRRIVDAFQHPVDWFCPIVWHPDSQQIFFVSAGDLFIVHVDSGHIQRLTTDAGIKGHFSLAPDAKSAVFSREETLFVAQWEE